MTFLQHTKLLSSLVTWRQLKHIRTLHTRKQPENWNYKKLIHYPYLSDIEDNYKGLDLFISHFSIQSLLTDKLCFKIEDDGINSTWLPNFTD